MEIPMQWSARRLIAVTLVGAELVHLVGTIEKSDIAQCDIVVHRVTAP